ncbi:DUF4845 domain-containing protein [Hahella sp. KA22]|uniref:DUF4845 domain-containing protein n=1 Tax=Hahella sp. KA22 TaxID=1628392 RepID=UPI000FDF6240|nr:DUF4845 domain-containing protein [Hahella sp. KA22]AZZ93678.1 DUF4845 domain-containing protein [Hahella sp. KA22]QAY57053.1 DUF4845 domain-containing protein [Hahella sp. KA22]
MRKSQQGASLLMVLVWIIIGLSVITLGIKLTPIYIEDYAVASSLQGLNREADLTKISNKEIFSRIDKHFTVNNVRNFDKDNIHISREKTKLIIDINYEARTSIISNIDAVLSFKHHLEANNQ